MKTVKIVALFIATLVVGLAVSHLVGNVAGYVFSLVEQPIEAQGGMSKATAKLLVTDLIEAGFTPTIEPRADGTFYITVSTVPAQAGTATQVNTFAVNRGVTARVLTVRFE